MMTQSFHELMQKPEQTNVEKVLVQAIAQLSTKPGYDHLTPEEVYNKIVRQTIEVHEDIKKKVD